MLWLRKKLVLFPIKVLIQQYSTCLDLTLFSTTGFFNFPPLFYTVYILISSLFDRVGLLYLRRSISNFKKIDVTEKELREVCKYMKILSYFKCLFILVRNFVCLQYQFRIESIQDEEILKNKMCHTSSLWLSPFYQGVIGK